MAKAEALDAGIVQFRRLFMTDALNHTSRASYSRKACCFTKAGISNSSVIVIDMGLSRPSAIHGGLVSGFQQGCFNTSLASLATGNQVFRARGEYV